MELEKAGLFFYGTNNVEPGIELEGRSLFVKRFREEIPNDSSE